MALNKRKEITSIIITFLLFSLFSFSATTFAAHEKISPELISKINDNSNSVIPIIVQTQHGLQEKHKTRILQLGGKLKHELS